MLLKTISVNFGFHAIVRCEWLLCYWNQVFIWLATRQICQSDDWRAIWQSYHRACYLLCKTVVGWTFTAMKFVNIRHNLFSNYTELKYLFPKHKHAKILHIIERRYILCLIIIIKSEVWTITHCLGLGHETMVCAVCLSIFLWDAIDYYSNSKYMEIRMLNSTVRFEQTPNVIHSYILLNWYVYAALCARNTVKQTVTITPDAKFSFRIFFYRGKAPGKNASGGCYRTSLEVSLYKCI